MAAYFGGLDDESDREDDLLGGDDEAGSEDVSRFQVRTYTGCAFKESTPVAECTLRAAGQFASKALILFLVDCHPSMHIECSFEDGEVRPLHSGWRACFPRRACMLSQAVFLVCLLPSKRHDGQGVHAR